MTSARLVLWTALSTVAIGIPLMATSQGQDIKALPPERRTFDSPGRTFVLEVLGSPGWKTPTARADLLAVRGSARVQRWSIALPHRYGPGLALVSDRGEVLLIDEWVRTPSRYALMLVAADSKEISRYSMTDIATVSGVPASELVTKARFGPWLSSIPRQDPGRDVIHLEAGDIRLELHLGTGRLTRAPS